MNKTGAAANSDDGNFTKDEFLAPSAWMIGNNCGRSSLRWNVPTEKKKKRSKVSLHQPFNQNHLFYPLLAVKGDDDGGFQENEKVFHRFLDYGLMK